MKQGVNLRQSAPFCREAVRRQKNWYILRQPGNISPKMTTRLDTFGIDAGYSGILVRWNTIKRMAWISLRTIRGAILQETLQQIDARPVEQRRL